MARRLKVPQITVDFSNVEEFEALPKGEYAAVIAKAEYRIPSDSDKFPYINLEMDVKDVVKVAEEVNLDGTRKLWAILSLSPKALWRTKQVFENLGIYAEEMELDVDEETMQVVSPELVGLPVHVTVSQRVYEGRTQNQVDAITSPDGGSAGGQKGSRPKKTGAARKSGPARGGARQFK